MKIHRVIIRYARAGDCPALQALYVELTRDDTVRVLPEMIEAAFFDSRTLLLVAEMDGQVCGTALVSLCTDVMYGSQPFAVVENVIVKAGTRRSGIGKQLIQRVELLCLEHDCSKIMLLSSASRVEAHTFFEKAGFVSDKKRGFVKYRRHFQTAERIAHNTSVNEDMPHAVRMLP
jgi:N-acetylglutamate synthase-like GNAT family acetyltransferase